MREKIRVRFAALFLCALVVLVPLLHCAATGLHVRCHAGNRIATTECAMCLTLERAARFKDSAVPTAGILAVSASLLIVLAIPVLRLLLAAATPTSLKIKLNT